MMSEPLPIAASRDHLTLILQQSGVLDHGHVSEVVVERSLSKLRSLILRLRLTYEGESGLAPRFLILKTGHLDCDGIPLRGAGRQEVAFYRDVAPAISLRASPRCFEAIWDGKKGWHLLLEDLTGTHIISTEWPVPPGEDRCKIIVQAQARFHAAWWNDPRLGTSVGRWRAHSDLEEELRDFGKAFERFVDRYPQLITAERRQVFAQLLDRAPGLYARYHSRQNLTIIHGDAHVWNCFLPRDGLSDALLFDWETWSLNTATDDLAYMMAMHWYPDRRQQMEQPLLDHYHAMLVRHGVRGYDRRALNDDYRLSALWQITRPILQESINIAPRVWWNNLERAFLAVDDLGCRDLLA
jgi:thiamine kinase-like enzyme